MKVNRGDHVDLRTDASGRSGNAGQCTSTRRFSHHLRFGHGCQSANRFWLVLRRSGRLGSARRGPPEPVWVCHWECDAFLPNGFHGRGRGDSEGPDCCGAITSPRSISIRPPVAVRATPPTATGGGSIRGTGWVSRGVTPGGASMDIGLGPNPPEWMGEASSRYGSART